MENLINRNNNLHTAKNNKADEFYTQLPDIEQEIEAYLEYNPDTFKNKVILCPCDAEWSNFVKYFKQNKDKLKYKKFLYSWIEKKDTFFSNQYCKGDFRSKEVCKLRDEADIIITNPPFSLFREFVDWVMEADKKFLILGNNNAITYKEVFKYIKYNKMWLGTSANKSVVFKSCYKPEVESNRKMVKRLGYNPDDGYIMVQSITWFTNLEHNKRHSEMTFMSMEDNLKYNTKDLPNGYVKYDNYDAIEVPKVSLIPKDYTEEKILDEEEIKSLREQGFIVQVLEETDEKI